jgi:hypothetical protein
MRRLWLFALGFGLLVSGCGRYFAGPIRPLPEAQQQASIIVEDDGTAAYKHQRLEISLRPLTDAELNRAFPAHSNLGARSTNPYTFGDWTTQGENWTPPRFTVFLLQVKNYAFPKVHVDPAGVVLRSASGRTLPALSFMELDAYYRAHAQAWAGNAHRRYSERRDLLRRTMYSGDMIFSGQEDEGYVLFPPLPADVTEFGITISDIALRFNYAGEPLETRAVSYRFERDVRHGYRLPADAVTADR